MPYRPRRKHLPSPPHLRVAKLRRRYSTFLSAHIVTATTMDSDSEEMGCARQRAVAEQACTLGWIYPDLCSMVVVEISAFFPFNLRYSIECAVYIPQIDGKNDCTPRSY